MSSSVATFLRDCGISLEPYGSAECGLRALDALRLIDLLFEQNIPVHGIEEWRYQNGGHVIEPLGGWYSQGHDLETNHLSAKLFIAETPMSPQDVLTVQFEDMASHYASGGRVGA